MSEPTLVCDECGQDFGRRSEIEEHLVYNHEVLDRFISVDDPVATRKRGEA